MSAGMDHNDQVMEDGPRRTLRADAERNRRRLLEAAAEMFGERGLDVGVGEIAQQAGVGRGTLFRNFPTKDHLIAAILVDRMNESIARGRAALDAPDPGAALFDLMEEAVTRSRTDRALFDSLSDTWMSNTEIRTCHIELLDMLDGLVRRAQDAGTVRDDVSAVDVLMLIKGMCESLRHFTHATPAVSQRQLDLIRAALQPQAQGPALRGLPLTIADLEPEDCTAASTAESVPLKAAG